MLFKKLKNLFNWKRNDKQNEYDKVEKTNNELNENKNVFKSNELDNNTNIFVPDICDNKIDENIQLNKNDFHMDVENKENISLNKENDEDYSVWLENFVNSRLNSKNWTTIEDFYKDNFKIYYDKSIEFISNDKNEKMSIDFDITKIFRNKFKDLNLNDRYNIHLFDILKYSNNNEIFKHHEFICYSSHFKSSKDWINEFPSKSANPEYLNKLNDLFNENNFTNPSQIEEMVKTLSIEINENKNSEKYRNKLQGLISEFFIFYSFFICPSMKGVTDINLFIKHEKQSIGKIKKFLNAFFPDYKKNLEKFVKLEPYINEEIKRMAREEIVLQHINGKKESGHSFDIGLSIPSEIKTFNHQKNAFNFSKTYYKLEVKSTRFPISEKNSYNNFCKIIDNNLLNYQNYNGDYIGQNKNELKNIDIIVFSKNQINELFSDTKYCVARLYNFTKENFDYFCDVNDSARNEVNDMNLFVLDSTFIKIIVLFSVLAHFSVKPHTTKKS